MSYTRQAREPHTPVGRLASLPSLTLRFSLVADFLFDCSRLVEYAKIRSVLQSIP